MLQGREAIFSALFNLVSAVPGLVTTGRRLVHWSEVPPDQQPALFQAQKTQNAQPRPLGVPTKWTLKADLYLYVNSGGDSSSVSATPLNNYLDAIEAALAPNIMSGVQTLGGLVKHCFICGEVLTDEGTLGSQAVAIIPIEIQAV
jgi:hypothetical protein